MSNSPYHHETNTMDILSIIFFLVAGAWLMAALLYSLLVLCFLRMRSNGTLGNVYDEDFGRVDCCGLVTIHMGCIFRRYARHLQMDEDASPTPVRFMTKEERRAAVQHVLRAKVTMLNTTMELQDDDVIVVPTELSNEQQSDETDEEQAVCSICLCGYDDNEETLQACDKHVFHKDCILDWLQLPNRTDCPCCRTTIVAEETIYKTVKKLRKQRKQKKDVVEDLTETERMGEDEL